MSDRRARLAAIATTSVSATNRGRPVPRGRRPRRRPLARPSGDVHRVVAVREVWSIQVAASLRRWLADIAGTHTHGGFQVDAKSLGAGWGSQRLDDHRELDPEDASLEFHLQLELVLPGVRLHRMAVLVLGQRVVE